MRKAGFIILASALVAASLASCASPEWSDTGMIVDKTQPKKPLLRTGTEQANGKIRSR
jgi:type IV pilus biogenesis protein CpaD/CtpE